MMSVEDINWHGAERHNVTPTLGIFEDNAKLNTAAWAKLGAVIDISQISHGTEMEDCVVFKGHDGYYYALLAADTTGNFRHIYLVRGNDLNFSGFVEIGMVINNPAGNYQDVRIRPRSIVYDDENERYVLFYDARGSVVTASICCAYQTKANLTTVPWTLSPVNPIITDGDCEGMMAFKRWGAWYAFYHKDVYPPFRVGASGIGPLAAWAAPVWYFGAAEIVPQVIGIDNWLGLRGCLEVEDGYLISLEGNPAGSWQIALGFLHKSLFWVAGHQNNPIITATLPIEGTNVANGFLFRDVGSPTINIYYNGNPALGNFTNVCRAVCNIRKSPPWTHGW